MKKIIIGLLALVMLLGFAGCKKDAEGEWRAEKWYIWHDEPLEYSLTEPEEADYSVWTVFISENSVAENIVAIKFYRRELENDNWVEIEGEDAIPAITEDIIYKGVNKVTDITMELLFGAKCFEEDLYQVQRDLYRELKLLLDRNNVASFAPPTYVIEEQSKGK